MKDMTLGQRIAECRKKKGLSQEALGEKLGVSRQAISKWEADGAVPEVDKLIGTSRLFGVSVGWLLGIEEEAPPEQKPEISEELLRKIEEIVLRYRPRKQPMSTKKKVLIGIAVVLVLWLGCTFFSQWQITRTEVGYLTSQIRNNNEQTAMILQQLHGLETRVDEVQFLSVTEYSIDVEPHETLPAAILDFHVVPSYWNESFKATLTVQYESKEILSENCTWNSSGIHATVQVDVQDGYEYWLVVEYPDGMKNQFLLTDEKAENLLNCFTFAVTKESGEGEINLQKRLATFSDYSVRLDRPEALLECDTRVLVKSVEYRFYVHEDGNDFNTPTLLGSQSCGAMGEEPDFSGPLMSCRIVRNLFTPIFEVKIPSYKDHKTYVIFHLMVYVELENGLSTEQEIGRWIYNMEEVLEVADEFIGQDLMHPEPTN